MPLFIDKLAIASPDFGNLTRIPDEFTADGGHSLPRLEFSGAPEGTAEYALICHDPDAPLPHGFTHFVVYGIPADAMSLDLDADGVRIAPNGADFAVWYGPEPPRGHGDHHYYFWLYALNRPVEGEPTREQFLAAYGNAIIEQARTVGVYSR
ncbi:YbhB/YbcL family Raf kinase inhibitor-like protein [Microbacterium marinilacus]|uniref:YbhB/YbcL family Raf kinase inhibitor-like protein n=1 Tax=Microbacterium marinilacus TaxID=415209 RepID=A0ABP7BEP6_9MICO|nr:YbhB/YbcL family Raf kinase inhibitor-like protein [Microbacterium marinilacus]MBY0689653.1 YbhB/YbcL family Raf kinase inhibitor-like protein [Microbacterium marinilacus]